RPPPTTPARVVTHSAADLAAAFVPPQATQAPATQPQTVQNPATGTVAYRVDIHGLNPMYPGAPSDYTFTPVPVNGFPQVVFGEPDGLFAGLPQARVSALTSSSAEVGPCVVAQVHNLQFPAQHELHNVTEAMAEAVRRITGELNPLIVPPEREYQWTNAQGRQPVPITWAILGISEEAVQRILSRSVWSSPRITIRVSAPVIAIGRFMFVLGGFAHDRNNSILNAVFGVFSGAGVLPQILDLVRTNPRFTNITPETAARAILASLEVRVSTLRNGNILAVIFCDPPTELFPRWRVWRNHVADLPYPSTLNSTGLIRRAAPCAGCHSADHAMHLCPFQDVPGWNAPAPGTHWAQPTPGQAPGQTGNNNNNQNPPPPPPPGGASSSRGRVHSSRRTNSSHNFNGYRRDFQGGGPGSGAGAGSGMGSGGGKGAAAC
ncbi:hypothetical protein VTO73DRAFT_11169, partial [Trametes versicolor]